MARMDKFKIKLMHIGFWIKFNHLKFTTSVGCIAMGIIIGILCTKGVVEKYDWLIGIITGLITSTAVSVFLDICNKTMQKKKDDAIKRATIFHFWSNMIIQSMHMLTWKYPLYHHACDIDYMEQFVKEKVIPLESECQNTIQFYSAVLTKFEFVTLDRLLSRSQQVIAITSNELWDTMKSKKMMYHHFYDLLGHKDKMLNEMSETQYNEIRENIEYIYAILRAYLGELENAVEAFSYLFHDVESYKNLHSDIIKSDIIHLGLLEK